MGFFYFVLFDVVKKKVLELNLEFVQKCKILYVLFFFNVIRDFPPLLKCFS